MVLMCFSLGLKYHITHGSCNFAPPKDLEHVQAILERKRRDKAAAEGVTLDDDSTNASPSGSGLNSPVGSAFELGISDAELRDIEREAEKKLKPFACTIGDCTRRYKNMNGLRYHYQHTGEHGAIGLGLLASGQHECLKNNSSSLSSRESSAVRDVNQAVREGRKIKLTVGSSKPGSRASSTGKEVKPKAELSPAQVPQTQAQTQTSQVPTGQVSQPTQFTVQAMGASSFSPATPAQAQVQAQAQLAYQQRFMDHQRAQFAQQQQQHQMMDAHAQNHMQAQILAMQNSMYNAQISSPPVTMAIPRKSSSSLDGALDG
jgi:transcription factor SFP1